MAVTTERQEAWSFLPNHSRIGTGACTINRPCAQQYVGKSQSCMVISGRLIVHAPVGYWPTGEQDFSQSLRTDQCMGQVTACLIFATSQQALRVGLQSNGPELLHPES